MHSIFYICKICKRKWITVLKETPNKKRQKKREEKEGMKRNLEILAQFKDSNVCSMCHHVLILSKQRGPQKTKTSHPKLQTMLNCKTRSGLFEIFTFYIGPIYILKTISCNILHGFNIEFHMNGFI